MPESLTAELIDLRDRVRAFIEDDLQPLEATLGEDATAPVPDEIRRRVRERSRECGFFQMTQPRAFGGSEAGPMAFDAASTRRCNGANPCGSGLLASAPC